MLLPDLRRSNAQTFSITNGDASPSATTRNRLKNGAHPGTKEQQQQQSHEGQQCHPHQHHCH
jgi:hypothetical protein